MIFTYKHGDFPELSKFAEGVFEFQHLLNTKCVIPALPAGNMMYVLSILARTILSYLRFYDFGICCPTPTKVPFINGHISLF